MHDRIAMIIFHFFKISFATSDSVQKIPGNLILSLEEVALPDLLSEAAAPLCPRAAAAAAALDRESTEKPIISKNISQ